jgi:phospholipase C
LLGASSVDLAGEHHLVRAAAEAYIDRADLMGRPYGLGPRAPMYVISPWSRGGWVDSQVFDHTSVIRFLEARFGVAEPNISPWRRAVCGDLTSAFDFQTPNREVRPPRLPATAETAARAAALPATTRPPTPAAPAPLTQAQGVRRSRALPYALEVAPAVDAAGARLSFQNQGAVGAVLHVYDRNDLAAVPRRYTVGPGAQLGGLWPLHPTQRRYDLWVLGPNGFHRHFAGAGAAEPEIAVAHDARAGKLVLRLINPGPAPAPVLVTSAYAAPAWRTVLAPGASVARAWPISKSGGWYDLTIISEAHPSWLRRLAGRLETGRHSISDPAMGGAAVLAHSL